jgi:hypothetical protein
MSYVIAAPEFVSAAATDLANIGSAIGSAIGSVNAAALAPTSGVLAAGADEVSAAVAGLFLHAAVGGDRRSADGRGVVDPQIRFGVTRRDARTGELRRDDVAGALAPVI